MSILNYITWDVSPSIFSIGSFEVRWYGLLFALAFVFGQRILTKIYVAEGRTEGDVDVITLYMIIGTVVGARLGHTLFYQPEYYLSNPIEILKIWEGGLASHGATIGILLALWLFSRKHNFDYMWVLDRIVIVVALGGALIRLGNLMNSEIFGRPTDLPWGFIFVRQSEYSHVPRHPTQLYESFSVFLLFVLLYWLWKKYKEALPKGLLFGIFVTALFTFRFLVEFLKEVQVEKEATMVLNIGQQLSIPLIIIGLFILFRVWRNPKPALPGGKPAREAVRK
ncbi:MULTISPECIES: prolipoprotein diacylglyceryl transferase [Pontibacter]|uniref:Phosphatidylglycerol--prolipoprotein diacylglyceryl transferase n=1 Tax=Pontibacter lucknowensis TaxID=1077936 RepID=A0A1N6T4K9_9BACT|nr:MULTISPECIES: prolipoprotein diacylglyceryl transferase [Pontibacter]EJF08496.1 prolipoprotein diacylglyceryl transferase [Pontibacter sp. BAB1700]SIQ48253.1 prolipoprotein diacylglyceryl transferase [Pontibacter lucknowensis]